MIELPPSSTRSEDAGKGAPGVRIRALCTMVLMAGLVGCRHKSVPYTLPQIAQAAPIELEQPSELDPMPQIAEQAPVTATPAPVATGATPPAHRVSKRKTPAAAAPVQVASSGAEPGTSAIGALSAGGDAAPQSQQEARDLITASTKRVEALPPATVEHQKGQVRQVSRFLKQAEDALKSGDAQGAKNLATKARLLLDDIEKK